VRCHLARPTAAVARCAPAWSRQARRNTAHNQPVPIPTINPARNPPKVTFVDRSMEGDADTAHHHCEAVKATSIRKDDAVRKMAAEINWAQCGPVCNSHLIAEWLRHRGPVGAAMSAAASACMLGRTMDGNSAVGRQFDPGRARRRPGLPRGSFAEEAWAPRRSLHHAFTLRNYCRDGGIRTHDPLTPSQVRYQAAPRPGRAMPRYIIAARAHAFAAPRFSRTRTEISSGVPVKPNSSRNRRSRKRR
jgi:hypothetical protein